MADPLRGFEVDSLYRSPVSALLEHPGLLVILGAFGIVLVLVSPQICIQAFDPARCTPTVEVFGWVIAGVGFVPYVFIRLSRLGDDDSM